MATTPRLAFPLRIDPLTKHLAVNEQDSLNDVADCVEVVALTRPGQRAEHPRFGTSDLTFRQRPLDLDAWVAQNAQWEPRARLLAEEDPTTLDELFARVRLTVEG